MLLSVMKTHAELWAGGGWGLAQVLSRVQSPCSGEKDAAGQLEPQKWCPFQSHLEGGEKRAQQLPGAPVIRQKQVIKLCIGHIWDVSAYKLAFLVENRWWCLQFISWASWPVGQVQAMGRGDVEPSGTGTGPVRCQQHGRCVRLGPERDQSLSGEAEHITPASIKIVNSCAAHLRQNIPEEGEWNPFHKEWGVFSQEVLAGD